MMVNLPFSLRFLFCFILIIKLTEINASGKVKKDTEDNDDMDEEPKDDRDSLEIEPPDMGKVTKECTRRSNDQVHEIQKANHEQFPFVVALLSSSNEYVCAGSIISNGLILTTTKCAENTNYILFNSTIAKKNDSSVILPVIKSEGFPTQMDVSLLYTHKLNNTNISKICISNITKIEGVWFFDALGYGLNAEVGQTKELQFVGLEGEKVLDGTSAYLNCIDTKVPSCFRDAGGPLIMDNELVGIVTKGDTICVNEITSKYAVNKHMFDFLPSFIFKAWLTDKIDNNEKRTNVVLDSYSKKTIFHETAHRMASGAAVTKISLLAFMVDIVFVAIFINAF